MAAHSLSIAKASLLASCLRPDPTKLNRDDLVQFHAFLETSISQCTPRNIQNTKQWLLQHILQSAARTAALSKYLASLSKNIDFLPSETVTIRPCRRQLHILYILNDIFHHVKYHSKDGNYRKNVQEHVPTILPSLFAKVVEEKKQRTTKRLNDLLDIWSKEKYCEPGQISALRVALLSDKSLGAKVEDATETKTIKEVPWVLPPTHGDPDAPYFDLPAGNLMPHIIPNISRPLRPDQIRPLQFTAGPADESLVNAMKDFLRDVKSIDDPYAVLEDEGIVADIDEMGQISYRNEADDVVGDTYYGWSRAFCEKMKNRGKESDGNGRGFKGTRSRTSDSTSRSRSFSRSRSPRKRRRRYSTSRSRSRGHSRSHSRSRSPSQSSRRADSPPPRPGFNQQAGGRRASPPNKTSHSRSYSPDPPAHPRFQGPSPHQTQQRPPPLLQAQSSVSHSPPFPPQHVPPPFPHGSPGQYGHPYGSSASPPPRPPNWQGPWPPPPPPPPGSGLGFSGGAGMGPNMMFPPPPPPPPPPGAPRQDHGNGSAGAYGRR